MSKIIGFILFWIAVGLALSFYINNPALKLIAVILFLVIGYNLFCGD
ncbi:MAG: hypothetical protein GX913_08665 [Clostridiales bacterium]|nr:hypothetical protein [Clostridiales bacterium]